MMEGELATVEGGMADGADLSSIAHNAATSEERVSIRTSNTPQQRSGMRIACAPVRFIRDSDGERTGGEQAAGADESAALQTAPHVATGKERVSDGANNTPLQGCGMRIACALTGWRRDGGVREGRGEGREQRTAEEHSAFSFTKIFTFFRTRFKRSTRGENRVVGVQCCFINSVK